MVVVACNFIHFNGKSIYSIRSIEFLVTLEISFIWSELGAEKIFVTVFF